MSQNERTDDEIDFIAVVSFAAFRSANRLKNINRRPATPYYPQVSGTQEDAQAEKSALAEHFLQRLVRDPDSEEAKSFCDAASVVRYRMAPDFVVVTIEGNLVRLSFIAISRFSAVADALLAKRPWPVSISIAVGIGVAYALVLLGLLVAFGLAQFWEMPGLDDGTLDIRNALAGYWWFAHDLWRWPILALRNASWPEGTNAELFDICPLAAIIGKALATALGGRLTRIRGG